MVVEPAPSALPLPQIGALPEHVAVIMDGNGRWAAMRGLDRQDGHRAGAEAIRPVLERFAAHRVPVLTLFAFSTENWGRPRTEVEYLLRLAGRTIDRELEALHEAGIRLLHIGDLSPVPGPLRSRVEQAVERTAGNDGMTVNLAFNYGGRADIVQAVRRLIEEGVRPEDVTEDAIACRLETAGLPSPDLLVRTGGEHRISNFLRVAGRLLRVLLHANALARLRRPRGRQRAARVQHAQATLRSAATEWDERERLVLAQRVAQCIAQCIAQCRGPHGTARSGRLDVLRARLAVAAAGLPLLAALVASPEPVFAAAVTLALAAAAVELLHAAAPGVQRPVALGAAVATALLVVWMRQLGADFPLGALLALPAIALYGLLRPGPGPRRPLEAWWLGSVVYVGVLGAHWVLLRGEDDGRSWILVVLAATFATDTGAYAVGRLIGRHHVAPRISPGKTWEGAVAGYVAGAAATVGATLALDLDPGVAVIVTAALALPLAAEAGDLIESALKRRIGVKDTSQLLPGHGGLLDRMDSLLLVGPSLYWIVQWL